MESALEGVKVEHPRCPWCHEAVAGGELKVACLDCMAWHHRECFEESSKKCAACGRSAGTEGETVAAPRETSAPARRGTSPVLVALLVAGALFIAAGFAWLTVLVLL